MNKVYTCGYSGHAPQQLLAVAKELDAFVVDIRLRPKSRMPGWSKEDLTYFMKGRYFHLKAWGNVNYNNGQPIALNDPARGLWRVLQLLKKRSVILMCGCRMPDGCHRTTCAKLFHERGVETKEIDWPGEVQQ